MRSDFIASNWRPIAKNTLLGFVDLILPSGLIVRDAMLHRKGEREWIGLPGKAQRDRDGAVRRDDRGKVMYATVLDFTDRARSDAFQAAALAAVHRLVDGREAA